MTRPLSGCVTALAVVIVAAILTLLVAVLVGLAGATTDDNDPARAGGAVRTAPVTVVRWRRG